MKIKSVTRLAGKFADLLQVERVTEAEFVSRPVSAELSTGSGRVYGGLLLAQALAAAQATVPKDRPAISLHCRFLRPGDESGPIRYHVTSDMDGSRFAHRRVIVVGRASSTWARAPTRVSTFREDKSWKIEHIRYFQAAGF